MAFSEIKINEVTKISGFSTPKTQDNFFTSLAENTSSSGVYGGYFDMNERDDKYVFIVYNSTGSGATITINKGNAVESSCNLSESIPASNYAAFTLESGRFKFVTPNKKGNTGYADVNQTMVHGANVTEKGKVFITADRALKVAVIRTKF